VASLESSRGTDIAALAPKNMELALARPLVLAGRVFQRSRGLHGRRPCLLPQKWVRPCLEGRGKQYGLANVESHGANRRRLCGRPGMSLAAPRYSGHPLGMPQVCFGTGFCPSLLNTFAIAGSLICWFSKPQACPPHLFEQPYRLHYPIKADGRSSRARQGSNSLATKPEAASCSRQTLPSSEALGGVAKTDR
jgi:hypothetical protein